MSAAAIGVDRTIQRLGNTVTIAEMLATLAR